MKTGREFNMLQDVITHFSENPKKNRAITHDGNCVYNRTGNCKTNLGCAIGMYLSDKVVNKIVNKFERNFLNITVGLLKIKNPELLPKWMREMDGVFLTEIQGLHDGNNNWTDKNISKHGIENVKRICKEFDLPFEKLKFKKK